ncbi:hypothetical protein HUA74_05970 [Myxococcus sp. CA051A]|uniref:hypothetical protein n=1 Tax=unclassified Myxococcus TaxID=2648731 RepID=UPI00157B33C3|nr:MULTISPECIES: hypothetical protein [unclassified Myxococcus]NTX07408.1 hypothetical protein [Myxococcus sp. CA040A]NTX10929.1 hypothetical protein [Myxococcus sp. CA056]NTX37185.1 hypothetical protein [Myxococcus sp. CA033]NTX60201.1 hypothetical protein [Myxococcus sp. CA051A]
MRTIPSKKMSLLSETEARLVLSSAPRNLTELSTRELRGRVLRARRLMTKYESLARRQRREALGRRQPTRARRAEGNANTLRKATYFRQALMRFEKRLAMMERREAVAAKRARTVRKVSSTRRTRASAPARRATRTVGGRKPVRRARTAGRTATTSVRATRAQRRKGGARKQQRFGAVRRNAHTTSRNRRTQARSDQRR